MQCLHWERTKTNCESMNVVCNPPSRMTEICLRAAVAGRCIYTVYISFRVVAK